MRSTQLITQYSNRNRNWHKYDIKPKKFPFTKYKCLEKFIVTIKFAKSILECDDQFNQVYKKKLVMEKNDLIMENHD